MLHNLKLPEWQSAHGYTEAVVETAFTGQVSGRAGKSLLGVPASHA